ncbi:MAG: hypothetical protein AB1411_07795 [Nitrospirota bacterium]
MNVGTVGTMRICGLAALAVLACFSPANAAELDPKNPLNPPGPVYWCPHKTPDQQYAATLQPGCSPLVEEADKRRAAEREKEKKLKARAPIKIQDIQSEASRFAHRYREFLDCCASDPGSLDELEEIQDQAYFLLKAIQETGLVNMSQPDCPNCRGWTLSQIIRTVAQARDDLRKLRKRWQGLDEAYERLNQQDYEAASRERRRIQEEESALQKEFRPVVPPQSAPTGTDLSATDRTQGPPATTLPNRVGTAIESTTLPSAFGVDIGEVGSPASDPRDLNPRRGLDTQNTTLPTRQGTATQDTTLPNSTGFEIGTQQGPAGSTSLPTRVGPAAGDSSFNRR